MAGTRAALSATLVEAATLSGRVTTPDGKPIADAVVFVQDSVTCRPRRLARSATLDQVDKTFVPGLLPIVVGTKVRFPNHDQIQHHVYSFSRTKTVRAALYKGKTPRRCCSTRWAW